MTVGGGLFYLTMLIRHRVTALPYFFTLGIALDQLVRATGNTLDPTWFKETIIPIRIGETSILLEYWGIQLNTGEYRLAYQSGSVF